MASMQQQQQSRSTILPETGVEDYAKALETERTRADEVEKMYEELKKIHEECVEEFRLVQNQNQKFLTDSEDKLKQSDESIRELRRISLDQTKEVTQLRSNVITPQKQEILRLTLQTEIEKTFQNKIRTLTDENIALKSRNSTLTHENGALHGEMEKRENEHKRAKSDLTAKFERKLEDIKREKESLSLSVPQIDVQKTRQLQKDNDQLAMRLKAVEVELESTRTTSSRWEEERDREVKNNSRKIAEKDLAMESLKAENEIHKKHVETIRAQLEEASAEVKHMSTRILGLEEQKHALESEIETIRHKSQLELGREKVRLTTDVTNVQKEKNQLVTESDTLKSEIKSLQKMLDNQRKLVSDKEREVQLKISALIQQHTVDLSAVEEQKHVLESKISTTERRVTETETVFQTKMEAMMEEQKSVVLAKGNIQKEMDSLKLKLAEFQRMEMDYTRLQTQHSQMQQETKSLLHEIGSAETALKALEADKISLREELDDLHRQHIANEERTKQMGIQYADEKFELQETWNKRLRDAENQSKIQNEKMDKLRSELSSTQQKLAVMEDKHRTHKKKANTVTKELVMALKSRSAMLELVKDSVAPEIHQKSQEEVAHLKHSLSRLRSIVQPNDIVNHGSSHISMAGRPSVLQSLQSLKNKIDLAAQITPSIQAITGEPLNEILSRLRLNAENGLDSPESEVKNMRRIDENNEEYLDLSKKSSVEEVLDALDSSR